MKAIFEAMPIAAARGNPGIKRRKKRTALEGRPGARF